MSFQPKLLINQALDFETIKLIDITGIGANGFGVPNPTVNNITSAEITFSSENYVGNIILFFQITNGVIVAATKTDYNGNITNILAELNSTAFPFIDLEITATLLLGQEKYSDGCFDTIYKLNTAAESYLYYYWFFTVLNTVLCFDDANIKYANGSMSESLVSQIQSMYFAFLSALYSEDKVSAIKIQKQILKACAKCGCKC